MRDRQRNTDVKEYLNTFQTPWREEMNILCEVLKGKRRSAMSIFLSVPFEGLTNVHGCTIRAGPKHG